jgi:putative endonuclease
VASHSKITLSFLVLLHESSALSEVEGLTMYNVYIIKNNRNRLYIGVTDNLKHRLQDHNTGKGAAFTKNKASFRYVFIEDHDTLKEARQREIQIKKWRRDKKEMLIRKYNLGQKTKIGK